MRWWKLRLILAEPFLVGITKNPIFQAAALQLACSSCFVTIRRYSKKLEHTYQVYARSNFLLMPSHAYNFELLKAPLNYIPYEPGNSIAF